MMAAEQLVARAHEIVLASTLATYPDRELEQIVLELGDAMQDHAATAAMTRALRLPTGLTDLQSRYVELFDRGGQRASLYETEYGRMRGMSKGNDLADLAGFYHAFGLTLEETRHEMLDHIAVELEFYAVLLLKQAALLGLGDAEGVSIVEDARKKFLSAHLGGLARGVAQRPEVGTDPIYGPVFTWCGRLVAEECAGLGVEAAPLDFFPDEDARRDMQCGATHLPVIT